MRCWRFNAIQFTFTESNNFIKFFLFIFYYTQYFLSVPVVKEKIKVKLALATLTGAPITVVKEIIDTPQLIAEGAIKTLSM